MAGSERRGGAAERHPARHVVLGAAGFIGRHVTLALLRRGDPVLAASRRPPSMPPADAAGLDHAPLDLTDAAWDDVLRDGDIVHHYAWSTVPATANDDPMADLEANLRSTLRLLQAACRKRHVRVLFASSGGTVYGHTERQPVAESHPLDPVTAYGVSKVAAEKYVGFFRAQHGLDARVARLSNPYGMGQDPQGRQGAISVFLRRALAGLPLEIFGDGSVVRDYLHIDDAVRALLALADAPGAALAVPAVFNVGSGTGLTLTQLVAALERRVGRTLDVRRLPGRRFDVAWNVLDVARARSVLGWAPRIGIEEGLGLVLADHAAGRLEVSTLPSFPAATAASIPQAADVAAA